MEKGKQNIAESLNCVSEMGARQRLKLEGAGAFEQGGEGLINMVIEESRLWTESKYKGLLLRL